MTISGANLCGVVGGYVAFGNVVARSFGAPSATRIWAIVPRGARSGRISVHIPANSAPENGPLHPAEVALMASVFTVT